MSTALTVTDRRRVIDAYGRLADDAQLAAPAAPPQQAAAIIDLGEERIGSSGQDYSQGLFGEEYHADLDGWTERVDRLNELRLGDAAVASNLERLLEPILSGTWDVEPGPGLPEVIAGEQPNDEREAELASELVRANLLRTSAVSEYRMESTWRQFVSEMFLAQAFGVSVFERRMQLVDGPLGARWVVKRMSWLHPKSIERWHVDRDGQLLGIVQRTTHGYYEGEGRDAKWIQEFREVFVPASKLFIFTRRQEGDDCTGVPLIRHMYGAAKRKGFLERAQIVDAQKRAIGIPYYRIAPDTSGDMRDEALKQVKRMRAGANERSFIVTQGNDEIGFVDMGANVPDLSMMIRSQKSDIAAVAGTEFTRLGAEQAGGSRAVGEVQEPHFNLHVRALAESIREAIQFGLIEPMHGVNFAVTTPPVLRVADIEPPDIEPLVQARSAKLLSWGGSDEQGLRRRLRLAPLTQEEVEELDERRVSEPPPMLPGQPPFPPGQEPEEDESDEEPAADAEGDDAQEAEMAEPLRSTWRAPTEREQRFIALDEIDQRYDTFVEDFVQAVRPLYEAAVLEAIRKLRVSQAGSASVPKLKRSPLEREMTRHAAAMAEFGAEQVRREVRAQLAAIELGSMPPPPVFERPSGVIQLKDAGVMQERSGREIGTFIAINVDEILHQIERTIRSAFAEASRAAQPDDIAKSVAQRAALGRSNAVFAEVGRKLAAISFNEGRNVGVHQVLDEIEDEPVSVEMAVRTEVLDGRTCEPCRALDGREVALDSSDYFALMPPAQCEGGYYCRGFMQFFVEERAA